MKGPISTAKLTAFIATRDRNTARDFYRDILGLTVLSEDPFAVVFNAGGNHIRMTEVRELAPAEYTVLGWEVADISIAVTELRSRGVSFQHYPGMGQDQNNIWTAPGGTRVAWFKDPDGNVLSLSQHAI